MENISMTRGTLPQAVKIPEPADSGKQQKIHRQEPAVTLHAAAFPEEDRNVETAAPVNGRDAPDHGNKAGTLQQEQTGERTEAQEKYNQVMAEKAVENANQRVHSMGKSAKFEYNEKINRITITISDKGTDEVIREIPPEATQKMLERLHTMRGMLMDTEV